MLLAYTKAMHEKTEKRKRYLRIKQKSLTDEMDQYRIFVYEVLSRGTT